ncbi:hypothetical protein QOZ80_5BG0416150 [Eleusine coracana subsp. coracana]|nr:hypothetical protein QOZ80_5BG0416150 [Eleusine coracana subsp. coracana]
MSSLVAFLLVGSFILLAAPANAEDPFCPSNMNYTRGSTFQANLEALLSSLPAAAVASSGLFAMNSTGATPPDQAFGLAQCRADVNASDCRSCLDNMVKDMATKCPGQKDAMLFYDFCLLRHANASFSARLQLGKLMTNLTATAAYVSRLKFAAAAVEVAPLVTIYGMAQCTRDLDDDGCDRCLRTAVGAIPKCCEGKQGGQINYRTCSVRFEVEPFYNAKAAEAAMLPAPSPGSTGSDRRTVRTALLVSIAVAVTLLVVVLVALYIRKRNRKLHRHAQIASARHGDDDYEEEEMRSSESLLYDLSTLRAATDNFSEENKLGEGVFGPVYKGVLQNGQEIAVKRLSTTSRQGHVEMKNEVVLVAKLQHKNLVRILGCCIQEHERLLVYEFLSNNSLDKIIFDPARQHELRWGQRHKIIEGIGRGLLYLHQDSRLTIIHRDLKASNILLDKDMNPKISDFGLAKLFDVDLSVGNTSHIAGTYGYMSPEYALHGIFSAKSDVFSYGVLVLEIIIGRRNTHVQQSEDLLSFVWRCWRRGSISELLDGCPTDGRQPQEVLRCVHVGLLCVQEDPQLRPGMASVVIMLNSRSITLPAPTAPAFVVVPRHVVAAVDDVPERSIDSDAPREEARWPSINYASSVSDLEPR